MTILFFDDFESGNLSAWDSSSVSAGTTLTVTSAGSKKSGTYAAFANIASSSATAYLVHSDGSFPASQRYSVQENIDIAGFRPGNAYYLQLYSAKSSFVGAVYYNSNAGQTTLYLTQLDGTLAQASVAQQPYGSGFARLELLYTRNPADLTGGQRAKLTLYKNGAVMLTVPDTSTGTIDTGWQPFKARVGFEQGVGATGGLGYIDDAVTSDAYIGILGYLSDTEQLSDTGGSFGKLASGTSVLALSDSLNGTLIGPGQLSDTEQLSDTGSVFEKFARGTSVLALSDSLNGIAMGPGYLSDTGQMSDVGASFARLGRGTSQGQWTDSLSYTVITPVIHLTLDDLLVSSDAGGSQKLFAVVDDTLEVGDGLSSSHTSYRVRIGGVWQSRLVYVRVGGAWERRRVLVRRSGIWTQSQ